MFTTTREEHFNFQKHNGLDKICNIPENELVDKYDLQRCVEWIINNNYERTCLQFPQSLLHDSTAIAIYLQKVLGKTVYILADTFYGSCCVDEIAAQHVDSDSIIHFGHACLNPVIRYPVLYIFEKEYLDLVQLCDFVKTLGDDSNIIIFYDDVYYHLYSQMCSTFEGKKNVTISHLCINQEESEENEHKVCGRAYATNSSQTQVLAIYIGSDCVTLQNLFLHLPGFKWYLYSKTNKLEEYNFNRNKFLMQKHHLVEKVKEAKVIGILYGTLGIKNYLDAAERIKNLIKRKGKKCYLLSLGKPNVAKLANFPEIDVFVYIACEEDLLSKDFKEYYKPVVSFLEVEMALGVRPYCIEYSSNFREFLPGGSFYIADEFDLHPTENSTETSQDLLEKDPGIMVECAGAQYLSSRSWRGLEVKLGETEVEKAQKGRSGIAQRYENELDTICESRD